MDKPSGHRLAIEEAQCDRSIQGFQYKGWRSSQRQVQEIQGGSRIDECRYRVRDTKESREIRKETSEWEVRGALILTKSTMGSGIYSHKGVLSNHTIQVAHLWRWTVC